jgi:hypothetical protein
MSGTPEPISVSVPMTVEYWLGEAVRCYRMADKRPNVDDGSFYWLRQGALAAQIAQIIDQRAGAGGGP